MSTALVTLTKNFATRFGLGDNQEELMATLKATAFKGQVSDAQMTALMLVAQQYELNPWTREIYAFPDKNNGIVPVVGVDGWSRIMNGHPQFDGMEFSQDDESCTCTIYRKDRVHPIITTEYMSECKRTTTPWQSHPKRMLRHKAMIQCARLAFGFGGIYDQDEAERIIEKDITSTNTEYLTGTERLKNAVVGKSSKDEIVDVEAEPKLLGKMLKSIKEAITPADMNAAAELAKTLPKEDRDAAAEAYAARLKELKKTGKGKAPELTYAQIADKLEKASDKDNLDAAADLIQYCTGGADQVEELNKIYKRRAGEFKAKD